ncbi:hypothetical protein LOAG_05828 [Loa loa]|uniref:Uncharacterized protein n=1 Tax=Loa loa TaxID=7209 RepID=A0A1S0TYY4_LOALO|nr:hypothetical protein LOAG_05828 [Loa loa]EFO22656.1 hypothetical protein LOAG_05828 [Loa loa]
MHLCFAKPQKKIGINSRHNFHSDPTAQLVENNIVSLEDSLVWPIFRWSCILALELPCFSGGWPCFSGGWGGSSSIIDKYHQDERVPQVSASAKSNFTNSTNLRFLWIAFFGDESLSRVSLAEGFILEQ